MILITGATGFLGSRLAALLLSQGEHIIAVKRSGSEIPAILIPYKEQIEWRNADILDLFSLEDAFAGADYIYHCAAKVSLDPADRKELIHTNQEGTANVVNLCLKMQVKKLLHVSSVAAVGEARPGQMVDEDTYLELNEHSSSYGISKFESEREVWRGIMEGLNAVIVNPSIILGETDLDKGSGKLFKMVLNGFPFYTRGVNGMISVQDVTHCMVGLMNSEISGERFILSSENISIRDFFSEVARAFDKPAPSRELKPWMMHLAGNLGMFFKGLGINKETARSGLDQSFFNTSKIQKFLPYHFTPVREVVAGICAHLRNDLTETEILSGKKSLASE